VGLPARGVQLDFIRPGRPVENSYIESFNGRLRDECLNVEAFFDLSDVREKLMRWQLDYNQVRPHSALGDRSPAEFVREWRVSNATSLRTAGPVKEAPADAVHCIAAANPKPIQLSLPPSAAMEGGPEKLLSALAEQTSEASNLLETVN